MSRFALSFALVSVTSSLFVVGCTANTQPDASGESTQADDLACVYTSTGHVIDCVTPPEPSTSTGLPVLPPASSSSSSGSSVSKPGSSGSTTSGSTASGSSGSGAVGGTNTSAVCGALQAQLAEELGAAQACTVGSKGSSAAPQCDSWVPVWDECEQPIAEPGSAATKKYLETYALYTATHCEVLHLPCVAPVDEKSSCEPNPGSAASHPGHCAIDGASPGASSAE